MGVEDPAAHAHSHRHTLTLTHTLTHTQKEYSGSERKMIVTSSDLGGMSVNASWATFTAENNRKKRKVCISVSPADFSLSDEHI